MSARAYQVGDRVRITDHSRHSLHPDAQYVFEGVVVVIDPAAEPDSEHDFGPYLWADTKPYTSPLSGEVFDRVFCPLTDDLTAGSDVGEFGRSIELLEPAPEVKSDTEPSANWRAHTIADQYAAEHFPGYPNAWAVLRDLANDVLDIAPTNPSDGAVTSTPAPSDDTTPALVALDRTEAVVERAQAYQRAMGAALEWEYADAYPDSPAAMDAAEALDTLRTAIRAYKAVAR